MRWVVGSRTRTKAAGVGGSSLLTLAVQLHLGLLCGLAGVVGQASFTAVSSPHLFLPRGIYLHSESLPQIQCQLRV